MTVIKVENIEKEYISKNDRTLALRGVSFEIENREFVAVVGSSGSGKTTLLNIIGGIDREYKGRVFIDGIELKTLSDRKLSTFRNQKIGFIFQSFHLLNHLTVEENIKLPLLFSKKRGEKNEKLSINEILEIVGLKEKRFSFPNHLSAGEKQRVAISRAIFNNPQILLCDEPTGNLDEKNGEKILNLFCELNTKMGITLIVVTHEERISSSAHRIIRLEQGRII